MFLSYKCQSVELFSTKRCGTNLPIKCQSAKSFSTQRCGSVFCHTNVSWPNCFRPKDVEVFSSSKCQSAKLFLTKRHESVFVIQMSVGQIVFDQKTWKCFCHPNVSRLNCFRPKEVGPFCQLNISWPNYFQPKEVEVFLSSKCQLAKLFLTIRRGSVFIIQMSVGQIVFDQKTWRCFCQPNVSWPNCFF